jgi:hypothetical protein
MVKPVDEVALRQLLVDLGARKQESKVTGHSGTLHEALMDELRD